MSGHLPESGVIELGRPLETVADGGNNQTEDIQSHVIELENSFESYDGNVDDQDFNNSELQKYYKNDETENGDIRIPTYFKTYAESVKPNAPPHSYIQHQQPQTTFTD